MIKYLAESEKFKVYAIYESVYLKNKLKTKSQNDFDAQDLFISNHYGDPNDALIMPNEKCVIVSGCGISIYDIEKKIDKHLLNEPNNIAWTKGLHQDNQDHPNNEVRFVTWNQSNNLRVHKLDIIKNLVTEIE
ncbi:MAG: hypothetical protein MK066_13245 [Crocinitomicaceae bacterium]|nr:hypothetical protein [Crocinitomicaceae bacterium]